MKTYRKIWLCGASASIAWMFYSVFSSVGQTLTPITSSDAIWACVNLTVLMFFGYAFITELIKKD